MDQEGGNPAAAVFNRQELIARCLGNFELAERVLSKFQTRFEEDLEELQRAIVAENAEWTAAVAHRLKGAAANAAAPMLRDRTAKIEDLARRRALAEVSPYLRRLQEAWCCFTECVSPRDEPSSTRRSI